MVVCLVAFVVFGFLAIFSAAYRPLAKEALSCVFRRITLRKCETGLDKRIKAKITGRLMKKRPRFAKFIYKRFEILSWIFTALLIFSIGYTGYSVYNLINYGTCDPENPEGCIFGVPGVEPSCVPANSSHCTDNCTCEIEGCEAPDFAACEGNCTCVKEICGS